MAWNKSKEITMEMEDNFDFILEEGQNTSINLRKISWNGRPSKLDIRKWNYVDGKEVAMKGVGLSEDGANELASVLVEQGYGDTKRIAKALKSRGVSLEDNEEIYEDNETEEYYDPSILLG